MFYQNYYSTQASRMSEESPAVKEKTVQAVLEKEIITLLPPDKSINILELGSGNGSLLKLLEKIGYKDVYGIDVSEEQVCMAHSSGVKNIQKADIREFLNQCNNDSYDVIIGIDIIEHFKKNELYEILQMIKKALRINGIVIFRAPNGDAPFGSTSFFGDLTHELILNSFSAQQLMLVSGFKNIHIHPSHIRVNGFLKKLLQPVLWIIVVFTCRIVMFASGKSTKNVLLTPNLIIKGEK